MIKLANCPEILKADFVFQVKGQHTSISKKDSLRLVYVRF